MARVSIMNMLMVFAATAMLVDIGMAVDITVGRPTGGWDLSTDLSSWASSQTFSVGDNLDFQFSSTHDVVEVTKENYDSCGLGSPISTTVTSPARFPLADAGSRYFICGRGAHCSSGMKVRIDVVLTPSPPPPLQSTPPPAPTPQTTPPPSATPPSPMPPPQSTPPSPTPTPSPTTAPTPAPTPTPTPTQTTPPSPTPTPTPPQTTPPSSPTPPENNPSGSSPPPPITGETADPPSSAVTLKMTAGSILGFGLFVMMLLSL